MANKDENEGGKKGGGWFKAVLGTLGGLLSGAVVMYFGAWVDQAVKPAKPVPNFRVQSAGRTVHFENLSPGYSGWWDFGDGAELVPADGNHLSVDHQYARPGDYSVKLSLTNLIGEESDRTVSLHVEDPPQAKQPKVVSLQAVRVSPGTFAPATYKITAKTENASTCVWDLGDDRPLQAVNENTAVQEHWVTFDKPGDYAVEVVAINDAQVDYKTEVVSVGDAPAGSVGVTLTAFDAGTLVRTRKVPCTFSDVFRPDIKGDVCPLSGRRLAAASPTDQYKDWVITDVQLTGTDGATVSLGDRMELPLDAGALGLQNVRDLRLQLADDRSSAHLLGELTRAGGKADAPAPTLLLQGFMTEELRTPDSRTVPLPCALTAPTAGNTTTQIASLPPPPADWVDPQPCKLSLEVRDGGAVVAKDVPVPGSVDLTLRQRRFTLAAVRIKDQVRLDLTAP